MKFKVKRNKGMSESLIIKEDVNLVAKDFTYSLMVDDNPAGDITGYVIVIPNGIKFEDGDSIDLVVYAEDEDGNVLNFKSLQEAQNWIDTYKDNLHFHWEWKELHATPILEESLKEDTVKQGSK